MRCGPLLFAVLFAVLLAACARDRQADRSPSPSEPTPSSTAAAKPAPIDAAPSVPDAIPPSPDAAPPDAGWVEASGPCKQGEPVTWCGRVWPPKDENDNPPSVSCNSPRETSLAPLACFEALAFINIAGSGIRRLEPLRKLQWDELTVGPEIGAKALTRLRDPDADRKIVVEDPPDVFDALWCGEGDLDGGDELPSGTHNQFLSMVFCDTRIAAGCDGKGTATLQHEGRNKQTKRFASKANAPTRVTFTKKLKPLDGVYGVKVVVRCQDGKTVNALGRFWTQFMWAE